MFGGRFWCLSPYSDEDDSDEEGGAAHSPGAPSPMSVYVRTPEEGSARLRSGTARAEKRLRKRAMAREVARLVCRTADPGTLLSDGCFAGSPAKSSSERQQPGKGMALQPSTYMLDVFDPTEWTTVRRRIHSLHCGSDRVDRGAPVGAACGSGDRRSSSGSVDPGSNSNAALQRSVGQIGPNSFYGPEIVSAGFCRVLGRVVHVPPSVSSGGGGLRRVLGFVWRGAAAAVYPGSMAHGGGGRGGADPRGGGFAGRGGAVGISRPAVPAVSPEEAAVPVSTMVAVISMVVVLQTITPG